MKSLNVIFFICFSTLISTQAFGETKAPDFTLTNSNGTKVTLSHFSNKYIVLEWTNFSCPFVKKFYSVEKMQDLQETFTDMGVVWLSICSSAPGKQGHMSPSEINEALDEKLASPTHYLIDEKGTVGKLYNAKTTPHIVIINPKGNIIYDGAIDSIKSFKPSDIDQAINYVEQTFDETFDGKKVSTPRTTPYGCSVKYK